MSQTHHSVPFIEGVAHVDAGPEVPGGQVPAVIVQDYEIAPRIAWVSRV